MDQVSAFRETVLLAEQHGMPEAPGSDLGLAHLRAMLPQVQAGSFSEAKTGRWLGWAQCALVAADVGVTLADMKALNARHACGERMASALHGGMEGSMRPMPHSWRLPRQAPIPDPQTRAGSLEMSGIPDA